MAWFRAGASAAKFAIRRTLAQGGSYAARTRAIRRYFHLHRPQEVAGLPWLLRAFQADGHMKAVSDPLALQPVERRIPRDLDPAQHGFTEDDLDREFSFENRPVQTLRSILAMLEQAYCGSIGYEYMHIANREKCDWLRDKIETPTPAQRRRVILDRLIWSTQLEKCLAAEWPNAAERFGLEGGETLIPGMKELFGRSADLGVENIFIGMPEPRGRLNVLRNVVRKPLTQIFSEPVDEIGLYTGTGDVKCRLGTSYDRPPVLIGKIRAKQYSSDDADRTKNMCVLIHGGGSFVERFAGVSMLHLTVDPNYTTGGTIHIVVNDEVRLTAGARSRSRSSEYWSLGAKLMRAPIFHVNGDDVEAVVRACELAAEWRQTFHSDVVVDLVCYHRYGRNVIDGSSSFTQREMYKEVIENHPSSLEIYQKKLLESGQVTNEEIDEIRSKVNAILNEEISGSKDYVCKILNSQINVPGKREGISCSWDRLFSHWSGFKSPEQLSRIRSTGVKPEILKNVGHAITTLPENFEPHEEVKKIYEERARMIETGEGIDWAVAEALAFATLLVEGNQVRLSGLDVEIGISFSHRHYVVCDQETGENYCPLDHVTMNQNEEMFTVVNRVSSGTDLFGFELGYSMESPSSLVIWEAGFSDLSTRAAPEIFYEFVRGVESKWSRQAGLVVLLPYGYDKQGHEHIHRSGCLECFLKMSDDDPNVIPEIQECDWQVVNVTTAANYFHVLRRQINREFRTPLVVMAPKNFLRCKECKSNLSEFDDVQGHSGFKRLIKDPNEHSDLEEGVRRLILCSGKIYYELVEERRKASAKDVAICRVEQLFPFPYDLIQRELKRYPNAEIVWCQEEPENMGAYRYVAPRLSTAMGALSRGSFEDIKYVGRGPSDATATGIYSVHRKEQMELVQMAIQPDPIISYPF